MHIDIYHTATQAHFNELRRQAADARRVSELRRPRRTRRISLAMLRPQQRPVAKPVAGPRAAGC